MTADLQNLRITELAVLHEDEPANEGALVKLKKRFDPNAAIAEAKERFSKRLKRAEYRFYDDVARIKAGKPIEKKRKKRKIVVEEETKLTGGRQPDQLGPSAHAAPGQYPVGKALSDAAALGEARLQKAADDYCERALATGRTPGQSGVDHVANLSAYEQHRKTFLFDASAVMTKNWRGDGTPVGVRKHAVATSNSYEVMMKRAAELHDLNPDKTIEQHFSDIYCNPANVALAKADREFELNGRVDAASAAVAKRDGRTIPAAEDDTDDGDTPADEPDGDMDDTDEADDIPLDDPRGEPPAPSPPAAASVTTR